MATRVGIDLTALLGDRTGVGTFTYELTRRLASRSHVQPKGFAISWSARGELARVVPTGVEPATRTLPARLIRQAWLHTDHPTVRWFTGPVDVVHGPNFVVAPGGGAAELVTIHDLTPVRFPELCTRDTLHYPKLIRRALDRGAHVHAVSRFVADEVCDHFSLDSSRVTVVANGVSEPAPSEEGVGRDLAGAARYVLALGTAEPRKDLPMLVDAFGQLSSAHDDLRLVIAGPDGWGSRVVDESIAASPARDRVVRLARYVSDGERVGLLRDASVFAYPSRYEGFGLPPLEAMRAGVPVVATAAGAVPEIVGDAAMLTAVGDTEAFAAALDAVLTDDPTCSRLVERGHARAACYSWDRAADGLVSLYERLVDA